VLKVSVLPEVVVGYVTEEDVETSMATTAVLLASYILMNRLLVGLRNWKSTFRLLLKNSLLVYATLSGPVHKFYYLLEAI